jgi:hypothetical protein
MKNLLRSSVLVLISGIFLSSPALAMAATLSLSPATGTANRGCTLSLKIQLDTEGSNSDGTDAILLYDPTRFSAQNTSIQNGSIYPDFPGNSVDSSKGVVSISGISVGQPFNGSGTLATVNFQVLDNAPAGSTSIAFDFDPNNKAKTTDSNVATRQGDTVVDVLNSTIDGKYTVGTGKCNVVSGSSQGGIVASGSATSSAKPIFSPLPSLLPQGGIEGPTQLLIFSGLLFVVLGVAGLALL